MGARFHMLLQINDGIYSCVFWNIWVIAFESLLHWHLLIYITLFVLSDFLVKIVDVMDCSQQKTFRGHDAPVLSLSFDPKDIFLVIIFSPLFAFFGEYV